MLTIKVDSSVAKNLLHEMKTNQLRLANRRALQRAGQNMSKVIAQEVKQQNLVRATSTELKAKITLFDKTQGSTSPMGGEFELRVNENAFRAQRFFPRRTRVRKNGRVYRGVKIRVLGKTVDTGGFTLEVGPKGPASAKSGPRGVKNRKASSKYRRVDGGTIGAKQFVVKRKHRSPGTSGADRTPLVSIYAMSLADIVRFSNVTERAAESGRNAYATTFEHEVKRRLGTLAGKVTR